LLGDRVTPPEPERCHGRPALCPRCHTELAFDPSGPWCRSCRVACVGAGRYPPCPIPPVATGATGRAKGLRPCRAHARRLVDGAGPHAVIADTAPTVTDSKGHRINPDRSTPVRPATAARTIRKENLVIRRTTLGKSTAVLATSAVLAASLSACGSDRHAGTGRPVPATTTAAAPSTSIPAAPAVTGPALRAVLPTTADLARGITISGVYDTGTYVTAEADLPAPSLPTADCTAAPAIDADAASGDYRAAYASEELDVAGTSLQLVVAATNPGDAAKQLQAIRDFAKRCASFAAPDATGASVGGTVALDSYAGFGDEALRIRVTATGPNAAKYSQPEVILVRVGDKIAAVSDADHNHDEADAVSAANLLTERLTGTPK
jgi:hypothetical protein